MDRQAQRHTNGKKRCLAAGNSNGDEKALKAAQRRDWSIISMRSDWRQGFP
jgi:hypothetical protein